MDTADTDFPYLLGTVPFSRYGAWLGVVTHDREARAQGLEGDVLLRSYHSFNCTFASLVPILDGKPCRIDGMCHDGSLLKLRCGSSELELCFESSAGLRVRGRGIGLKVEPLSGLSHADGDNSITLNVPKALRKYRFEALKGALTAKGFWTSREPGDTAGALEIMPADDGAFDLAIDEYSTAWIPWERRDFDSCVNMAADELSEWLGKLPDVPDNMAASRRLAGYIDWSCVVSPTGLIKHDAMFMSKNWMCNIWSWDNCFNAMAMVPGHPELAMAQMLIMTDHQDEFGAYPDYLNDVNILRNFCKPPLHGWTVSEMIRRKPDLPREFIESMYESLTAWSRWWLDHRRLKGHSLPYYLHGNDSGWDNGTMFDDGVPLVAPDLAAFLAVQLDVVSDLALRLGDEKAAGEWKARADSVTEALLSELWDGERFRARHGVTGAFVESESSILYMPVLLGKRLPKDISARLADGIESCLTDWGPPTEPVSSARYDPEGYWRGPIWAPSTYLLVSGLLRCGHKGLALEIARRFCALCDKSGMSENYNAVTGEQLCDPAYSWTSSVFLLLGEMLKDER